MATGYGQWIARPESPIGLPARYRLDGLIATGGMAAVYAAHDTTLNRPVAVKVLAEHLTENDDARRRFEREARAAAALSTHPAVVTVYDVGEYDGRSFIVMERRMAGSIAEALARGPLDPARVLRWLADVAEAIDAAHARGVVHRDIKPGNLLLDEHDRVAIADFGIATLAHEQERVTQTGEVLGSGAYLSPEQARGVDAGPASDRYALAVVAYELLTGRPPFTGPFPAQLRAHVETPAPLAAGLPHAAQDVLAQGLAKDPAARWGSAAAFVRALRSALADPPGVGDAGVGAPPGRDRDTVAPGATDTATHDLGPAAAAGPDPSLGRGRPGATPRRGGPALAALALLTAGVVVALVLATSGGDPPTTAATGTVKADRRPRGTVRRTPTPTPPPTSVPTTAATPTPVATPDKPQPPAGSAAELNDRGYAALQGDDTATALSDLSAAVKACAGNDALDPCGYATYNLGSALVAAGQPADAIDLFRERLARWPDDQPGTVGKALGDACKQAGVHPCKRA